jgi:hypothetical protein
MDDPGRGTEWRRAVTGGKGFKVKESTSPIACEPPQPDWQPGHRQARKRMEQAGKARPAGDVTGDGEVRPVMQDRADERSQHAARPHLHEHPSPLVVHGHDHVCEADGAGHMLAEPFCDGPGVGRMNARIEI